MATLEELNEALKAADAAGNVEDARKLADLIYNYNTPNVAAVEEQFQSMPWYQKAGQAADDVVRGMANGVTLGWADNLAGALSGTGHEEQNRLSDEAKIRGGGAQTAAEILGMLLPASRISQGVGAATGMTARTAGESAIREGLAGGLTAGTMAASRSSEPGDILTSTGLGIGTGAAGGYLGSKLGDLLNWGGKKLGITSPAIVDDVVPPMTPDEMATARRGAYQAVDDMGVAYTPNSLGQASQNISRDLTDAGLDPVLHPRATRVNEIMQERMSTGGAMPALKVDDMRRIVGRDVAGDQGEDYMAGILRRNLDELIETGQTTSRSGIPAQQVSEGLKNARDLSRRGHLLEDITEALYKGQNNSNSTRGDVNRLRTFLDNPKNRKGMTRSELDALQRVVRGDKMENFLGMRMGGIPVSPVGAGLLTAGGTGSVPLGLMATAGTMLAKPGADMLARRYTDANIQNLLHAVAGGGTTPAASRMMLPVAGQAAGALAVEDDRRKQRRKNRN